MSPLVALLEKLLSKNQLTSDAFIAPHLSPQLYVPLSVLSAHPSIAPLLPNSEEAVLALKTAIDACMHLSLDPTGTMVRPIVKVPRLVLAARDVPEYEGVGNDLLRLITERHKDIPILSHEAAHLWYLRFNSEEQVARAMQCLKGVKLGDCEIKFSVKNEPLVRSFFRPSICPPIPRERIRYSLEQLQNIKTKSSPLLNPNSKRIAKATGLLKAID